MIESVPFAIAVASGMIRGATPVLLAAVGECITERAGILNLGLDGIMLAGALSAAVVSYFTHSAAQGLAAALLSGAILGLIHGIICIRFQANQVAAGIALTIFLSGVTAYLGANFVGKTISIIPELKVPGLAGLPILGPVLFNQDPLVYLCYLVVPAAGWLLYRTTFGLSVRAAGDDPRCLEAAGVNVALVRYVSTMLGASLAALGGAYLSLSYAQGWTENITAGRGWIAVGLVMFASWNPWRALAGAYIFGLATSLQLRLQAAGSEISPYLLGMLPYLMVISAMVLSSLASRDKHNDYPKALGVPYNGET